MIDLREDTLVLLENETFGWLFAVLVVGFVMLLTRGTRGISRIKSNKFAPSSPFSPVLLSYHTYGKGMLLAQEGVTDSGARYQAFVTTGGAVMFGDSNKIEANNCVIYRVTLPFQTKLHLLAIPMNGYAHDIRPVYGRHAMERVVLEGDFPSHFYLYADKGKQTQARYVLDPKSMAFVIDFCKSHSWEIINDEFYFVQLFGKRAADDPTHMHEDLDQFIKEIKPAVIAESQHAQPDDAPTDTAEVSVHCPQCAAALVKRKHWLACPQGHGIVINSREVLALTEQPDGHAGAPREQLAATKKEPCPRCGVPMKYEPYLESDVMVHSCYNCFHRWIENDQLQQLVV
jgi:Zn-finger nucleic acid-binding protein